MGEDLGDHGGACACPSRAWHDPHAQPSHYKYFRTLAGRKEKRMDALRRSMSPPSDPMTPSQPVQLPEPTAFCGRHSSERPNAPDPGASDG
jgi:hypothetical protein